MQTTIIVRDRYQITIPDEVRKYLDWAKPRSVVLAEVAGKNELIIRPFEAKAQKKVDWDKVWKGIQEARALSAKGKRVSLSKFIVKDRDRHRI